MRKATFALFAGIGKRIAWTVIAAGVLLLGLSVLLQAGKQQRQYRDMHQQQVRQSAEQAAMMVRSRIGNAELLLRAMTERFRRPTFGTLEIDITIDDAKAYTKPFTV